MVEKFLVLECPRSEFKEACLKRHRTLESMWLDVNVCPILVENKEDALADCRKWNRKYILSVHFFQKISVY